MKKLAEHLTNRQKLTYVHTELPTERDEVMLISEASIIPIDHTAPERVW